MLRFNFIFVKIIFLSPFLLYTSRARLIVYLFLFFSLVFLYSESVLFLFFSLSLSQDAVIANYFRLCGIHSRTVHVVFLRTRIFNARVISIVMVSIVCSTDLPVLCLCISQHRGFNGSELIEKNIFRQPRRARPVRLFCNDNATSPASVSHILSGFKGVAT